MIRRSFEIELEVYEEFQVVKKWCKSEKLKKAVAILLKSKNRFTGSCPFPKECRDFPCSSLSCNADECSNGYAFRRS